MKIKIILGLEKKPTQNGAFSEFMRNASSREKKKVITRAAELAIEDQRAVMRRAGMLTN